MFRFLVTLALLMVSGVAASADTIVLTNGRRIEVELAWQEGDVVKGNLYGSVVQYPRREVARILTDAPVDDHQPLRFGLWQLGMTEDQVLAKAKTHSITLRPQDVPAVPGIPIDPSPSAPEGFRYQDELLGNRAGVRLNFTAQTRILWRIQVVWRGDVQINQSRLKRDIANRYRNEYGRPDSHLKHSWFSESIHWTVGDSGTIRLRSDKGVLALAYSDATLVDRYEREKEAAREHR